ncbi:MAG: transcriptional repressor LexA [Chloroflexi bacterium]|nr:transcriptional repressor LexA [Chloroflexota bacterium]MDA8188624.1 transcriptional repressor LexA [Dehalococcoidales bacterium]
MGASKAGTAKLQSTKLTRRQQDTLEFVRGFVAENGYPPTVREVCAALGLSSSQTAYAHLCKLEQKGYLSIGRDESLPNINRAHRAIKLIDRFDGRSQRRIPFIGRVAAGQPLLATENVEGYIDLRKIGSDAPVFALRVQGDSMVEAGIFDGDYIIVRQQEIAEDGDIVVALLHDEATVKFFFRQHGRVRLQPANRKMKPILARDVKIVGKVIASCRGYGSTALIK